MPHGSTGEPVEIPVVCKLCSTRMYARPDQIGKTIVCPDCHTPNRVVAPPPKPSPAARPDDSGDEYRLAAEDPPARPAVAGNRDQRDDLVRVVCSNCHTLMYARREHVGKRIRCPDCGALERIPVPTPAGKRPFHPPDVSDIRLEEAALRPDLESQERAEHLLAKAAAEILEREKAAPTRPKRPFSERIIRFLFYYDVLSFWVAAAALLGLISVMGVYLIELATGAPSFEQILGVFLSIVVALTMAGWLFFFAPGLVTIIEMSSLGYDRIPHWSSSDLLERMKSVFFWFNSLALSFAPLVIASTWFVRLGLPLAAAPFVWLVALLPFPIVLLSMFEQDSPWLPASARVWRSFGWAAPGWQIFYVETLLLGALAMGGALSLVLGESVSVTVAELGTSAILVIFLVLYARLLGRLAWYIADKEPVEENEEGSEEKREV